MIYLYTNDCCPNCESRKAELNEKGIPFEIRDADRLKNLQDKIDEEALIQACMQNMELPVEVEYL